MKKFVLFLFAAVLGCGSVYPQVKKTPVRRSTTSVAAKQKAELEAKIKAESEAAEEKLKQKKKQD